MHKLCCCFINSRVCEFESHSLPLLFQTYFALRSTLPLDDWTHCPGPVEEAFGERPSQEAGFWTTGRRRY